MFFISCIYFFLYREMAMHEMEIPHEVLLSIERILDLQENVEGNDELASLSADFSPVGVLNTLFPDGANYTRICGREFKLR